MSSFQRFHVVNGVTTYECNFIITNDGIRCEIENTEITEYILTVRYVKNI